MEEIIRNQKIRELKAKLNRLKKELKETTPKTFLKRPGGKSPPR